MATFDGMNDTLRQRLEQMMADAPNHVGLASGFRTRDQQAALYAKNPKIAAAPGKSNHERGLAADLSFADGATQQWVHANAAKYGLFFPMSWEPWHVEALGTTRGTDASAYTAPPANLAPVDKVGSFLDIIMGRRQHATQNTAADGSVEHMAGVMGMGAKGAEKPHGALGSIAGGKMLDYQQVYDLVLEEGGTPEEAKFLAAVAKPESGYVPTKHNTNAATGDNSYGLLQVNMIGQMGVDRQKTYGLSSYDDLYDPRTNVRAALDIYRSQGRNAWKNSLPKIGAIV